MNDRDSQFEASVPRHAAPAWPWVALLLTLALIGLTHDLSYATAFGIDSAEAGRYFENQAEFQADVTSVGTGRKLGFGCLLFVGIYCAATVPRGRQIQWDALTLLIGLGLMWVLASVMWSVAPQQSIRELVRLFVYLFVAGALALRFDSRSLCLILMSTLMASMSISVFIEVITGGLRPWVPGYRLSGTMHSAAMGIYSMLLVLGSYVLARRQRSGLWWGVFFAAALTLILSKALTSLIACTFGMAAIHLFDKPKRTLVFSACVATTVIAAALFATSATDFWSAFRPGHIGTMGRDFDFTSFNGRIPLWVILCDQLEGRWLNGFGYGGFWVSKNIEGLNDELEWYASHAHSAYLGTVVHVGLVGLSLLLAVTLLTFRRTIELIRTIGSPEFYVFGSWLVAAFLISIAETAFVEPRDIANLGAAIVISCIVVRQSADASLALRQSIVSSTASLRTSRATSTNGQLA